MFNATIAGRVKRVIFDSANEKKSKVNMVKIVVEVRKQWTKEDDMPFCYPVVTLFNNDADYFREYAGKGHYVECINCDIDCYRGDDDEYDRISFKCGKLGLLPKDMAEAIGDTIEDDDDDDDKKKKKKKKDDKKSGKSRSERRKKRKDEDYDEDDDDDEEEDDDDDDEEEDRKKKKKSSSSKKKSSSSKGKNKKRRDEDEDDDDDDDDFEDDDDDDDYFDEDED
jgi:hypothetical protein